jgi:hypothetical protein
MVFADSPLVAGQIVVGDHTATLSPSGFSLSGGSGSTRLINPNFISFPGSQRSQITGTRLSNTLQGRAGGDRLYGRAGNDKLRGFAGNDRLLGEQGDDRLWGGAGHDYLNSGAGRNILYGEAGRDQLLGGKDADQLVGGLGADSLNGGGGRNRLTGGAGHDQFVITAAGRAEITDFKNGEDLLKLASGLKSEDLTIGQGTGQQANNTLIRHKVTGRTLVILNGTNSVTISDADFFGVVLPNPLTPTDPIPTDPIPTDPLPTDSTPDLTSPILTPEPPTGGSTTPTGAMVAIQANTIKFSASDPEATIAATGTARIQLGTQTIYIGTQQVSVDNQNPVIASFDSSNPANNWVRTDYEITGADGRGYGLFWSGTQLYGVFSVD